MRPTTYTFEGAQVIELDRGAYAEMQAAEIKKADAARAMLAAALETVAAWDMDEDTKEWNHEDRLEAGIASLRAAAARARAAGISFEPPPPVPS